MAGGLTETVAHMEDYPMRTYDLTPFYRSTVGFDRFFNLLDQVTRRRQPRLSPLQYRAHR